MTAGAGGGTRHDNQGASVTRSAEPMRSRDPKSETLAANAAAAGHASSSTMARPATCTIAIAGIAMRLQARPAMLTRENTAAAMGNSRISAATVAARIAVAALTIAPTIRGRIS